MWRRSISAMLLLASTAWGQIAFHGEVNPLIRITTDQRYLSLPHRYLVLNGEQRSGAVSLMFSTTLEYRLNTNRAELDLREIYVEVATELGDFRFGKQIFAWGAADGNNPTDNVNPYDFYYLFLPGTDRKVGIVSASANLYFGDLNIEVVLTPVPQPNRLPFNEPDFPIFSTSLLLFEGYNYFPKRELTTTEVGIRARFTEALVDISLSYFHGFDRMPSFIRVRNDLSPAAVLEFGYLQTNVLGADLVTFIGDFAIRAEGAYFITEDSRGTDSLVRNPYIQYVVQTDYNGTAGSWMVQYLGTFITGLDRDDLTNPFTGETLSEEENERNNLPAKMGMPFAAIAQNAVMLGGSVELADGRYSFRAQGLYDFDNGGTMLGGGLTVHLQDAFDLDLGLTLLGGDEASRLSGLKDFSHLSVAIKYSF